nr:hypothetical protein [Micromonospora sp. DSM 115978]
MTELWNWRIDDRVAPAEVYAALAGALGRPVLPLAGADPYRLPPGVLLCDAWHRPGDFPTSVDCYGTVDRAGSPGPVAEWTAVAAFARRLGRRCLLPDDTLDHGRHLLVSPDGTMRPVHVDVRDCDDGEVLSNWRLCTTASPRCRGWSCHRSRWAPDSVVPALAAA